MALNDMETVEVVVAAAGGELTGRTRLQKSVYLLNLLGLDSEFSFEYHYYGPYSAELAQSATDACLLSGLEEELCYRSDGVSFSVYRSTHQLPDRVGELRSDELLELSDKLQSVSATVLELAATAHWLSEVERVDDWRAEIRVRKGSKNDFSRLEKAEGLLRALGISLG